MIFVRYSLAFCYLCSLVSGDVLAGEPRVTLDSGVYVGVATQIPGSPHAVHKYLGVPFAASPTRFAPAVPAPTSTEVKKANALPPACIQSGGGGPESEDCLYLNVFAPAPREGSTPKAVMVWLYGGGLQSGSASLPMYDGSALAANQDVIIVAPNYRTNVFGFPGPSPAIPRHAQNLGLLDQRLALSWVQRHAARFHGDPAKVTLFGQSAGARSADFHLLTIGPAASPPFRAVIMQSGSAELTPMADASRAARSPAGAPPFAQLAAALGCAGANGTGAEAEAEALLGCMRGVAAGAVKDAVARGRLYFGSTEDGGVAAVRDQAAVRRAGRAANVSLLVGTNADEQRGLLGDREDWTLGQYLAAKFASVDLRERVGRTYAVGSNAAYKTDFEAIAAIETDVAYTCLTSREAKISAESGYPTWRYYFQSSFAQEGVPRSGSRHGTEIPFVFGTFSSPPSPEDLALSKQMQKIWADFAKNPQKGPGWSKVGSGEKYIGHLGPSGKVFVDSPDDLDRNCKLFDHLYEGRA